MKLSYSILLLVAIIIFCFTNKSYSQVFGMKGGVAPGTVSTKEVFEVSPMLNYYYEAYYAYRFGRYKYWTIGFGYLGTGATFSDVDVANDVPYKAEIKFNNFTLPIKLKVSGEGKNKPRPYFFVGAIPVCMFNEDRMLEFEHDKTKHDHIFQWTPNRLNLYALCGGGVYFRHVTLDIGFTINTLRDYKEIEAPISYNKNVILTIGYQVSRDTKKMW
ncbi:MAG: outer membrane beta-barrel protein [Bacteroidales bacterium]|nr:outer membrane beta-barrel protein [Bacteroidales bacterium]